MTPRNRRRLQLILVFAVFAVPPVVALLLGQLGWQPSTRSNGLAILPQRSFEGINIGFPDGSHWAWRDSEPRMTMIALPGPGCAEKCIETLRLVRNARITLNKNMDRVRLLYVGQPPADVRILQGWRIGRDDAGALAEYRPRMPDSLAVLVVESNGTALLDFPAGFDPNGLREDLQKVVR